MQIKDRRPNRHKGAPTYSWRKNRGKKGGFCGGAPGRDACGFGLRERSLLQRVRSTRSASPHERNYGQKTGVMYCIGRTLSKTSARRALTMMFVKARCLRPSAVGFVKTSRLFRGKISFRSDHSPHTVHFTIVV